MHPALRWAHRCSTVVLATAFAVGIGYGAARIPVVSFATQLAIAGIASIAALLVVGWHFWPGTFGYAVCLVVAMVATPPDPISFAIVGAPLCLLYFGATRAWTALHRAL